MIVHRRVGLRLALCAALLLSQGACSGDDDGPVSVPDGGAGGAPDAGGDAAAPAGCPAGTQTVDERCVDAGDGAGVPPDQCGTGFTPDGDGGCDPILPDDPCESGQLAAVGESECRDLAPCGDSPWGAIPVEPNTQYVDAGYVGGNSQGTASDPWLTIQEGVDHAEAGALVAIAAGDYLENVSIHDVSVRLWGRCPSMVTISGVNALAPAVSVASSVGAELHDLAVTGASVGLDLVAAEQVVVERVWIHDTADAGLAAGPGVSASVSGSLIERARGLGVEAYGASIELTDSSVRDTQPAGSPSLGYALLSQDVPGVGPASVTMTGTVIERNQQAAIRAFGTDLTLQRCVVRRTLPRASDDGFGRGFDVNANANSGQRSRLLLEASVVEDNHDVGVSIFGSDATIEHSVVRRTEADQDTLQGGTGLHIQDEPNAAERANVTISSSLIDQNRTAGVLVAGSDVVVESTIIRDTLPSAADDRYGRGLVVRRGFVPAEVGRATLSTSRVSQSREGAVSSFGSELTIDGTLIEDTAPQASDQQLGRGVSIQPTDQGPAIALVRDSVVTASHEGGIVAIGSELTVDHSRVDGTLPNLATGFGGLGIAVQVDFAKGLRATGIVRDSTVRDNQRSGVVALGSDLLVEGGEVIGTIAEPATNSFGDGIDFVALQHQPAAGSVTGVLVADNARAGVAVFGAEIGLATTDLACNAIDLNGEENFGFSFDVANWGDNTCRCSGDITDCIVLSAGLAPPGPLGGL